MKNSTNRPAFRAARLFRFIVKSLGAAALTMLATACAQPSGDLGEEWIAVDADDSSILFHAADITASQARFFRHQSSDYSFIMEYASWSAEKLPYGRALLVYKELSSGYHYRQSLDISDVIDDLSIADEHDILHGRIIQSSAHGGTLATKLFSFDDVNCLAFSKNWGSSEGRSSPNGGTKLLYGYFCADPGAELGEEEIAYVRDSITIR